MRIDLRKLYGFGKLDIDQMVNISSDYYNDMGVKSLSSVHVNGTISINYDDNIELNLTAKGEFIIPCAITLEDVIVPFETVIEDEIDQNYLKDEFYLDLLDKLWENIVLEIPIRVVKEGVKSEDLHGEGWEFVADKEVTQ